MSIGYFSNGIARLPFLAEVLGQPCVKLSCFSAVPDAVLGWGLKPTADKARAYASKKNIPYIRLEDAFIRSLGLGVDGSLPHGLVVDYSGIYYDARTASDLETLILNSAPHCDLAPRASRCMALLREHRLSKYNHAPDNSFADEPSVSRVLVVDQTAGDASVEYGLASAETFITMLDAAMADNPDADVWVKVHPDVISGKKQGYLLQAAQDRSCHIIAEDVNPWAVLDVVDKVYTVTSQLGFEALLAGKKVSCFGVPFYAGWGLTDDRQQLERRNQPRTLEQVFHAAYIDYCRYFNPYTGERCQLEDTIHLLALQKRHQERLRGHWWLGGLSAWKRRFIPHFLGHAAQVEFLPTPQAALDACKSGDNLLIWSSRVTEAMAQAAQAKGVQLWRMEDGFIRSVGLGADLVKPLSLVLDQQGIYYDARQPSELEQWLNTGAFQPALLARAERLQQRLVAMGISKYNVGSRGLDCPFPTDKTLILVPGQVETDASILTGSPKIKTNAQLLSAVRTEYPDAWIIYKPHPDVLSGGRYGELSTDAEGLYDQLVTDLPIIDLLERVDAVHTMSSLAGFEALLRGTQVVCWGQPFYAGWGLTADKLPLARRQRTLTLTELIAGALITYPTYIDPDSGDICDVETAVTLLQRQRESGVIPGPSIKTRLWRLYRTIFEGKR